MNNTPTPTVVWGGKSIKADVDFYEKSVLVTSSFGSTITIKRMMNKFLLGAVFLLAIGELLIKGCLITNCPRGGKRSGGRLSMATDVAVKPCVSCGPGRSGQCFGPNICCGPFGCLMSTSDTIRCQREGFFNEPEPCIAGNSSCRRNTGRCAIEGICCSQNSCHVDRSCTSDEKLKNFQETPPVAVDLYNLIAYQNELAGAGVMGEK